MLPGVHTGNVGNIDVRRMLVRPPDAGVPVNTFDFRPTDGTAMAKNGAGAFASAASVWWTPGPRSGASGGSGGSGFGEATSGGGSSSVSCVDVASCRAYYDTVRAGIQEM